MQLKEKDILETRTPRKRVVRDASPIPPPEPISVTGSPAAKKDWTPLLDRCFTGIAYGLLLVLPLFFAPLGTDVLELNKQTLLFVGTFLLALCWAARGVLTGSFSIRPSLVFLGIGGWLLVVLLASILSTYPYNSFVGIERQEVMSFATITSLALLIFLLAQHFTTKDAPRILATLCISSGIGTLFGILQLLGVYVLATPLTQTPTFNIVGGADVWGIFPATILVLSLIMIIAVAVGDYAKKNSLSFLLAILAGISLIALILLNDWHLWLGVLCGLVCALALLYIRLPGDRKISWIILPSFIAVFSLTMILFHPKIISIASPAQTSLQADIAIVSNTLLKHPFTGVGPGNFLTAFTESRPKEMNEANNLQLWAQRFDQSSSYLLTLVASTGLLGLAGIVFFILTILVLFLKSFWREPLSPESTFLLATGSALIVCGIELAVKSANLSIVFLMSALIAAFIIFTSRSLVHIESYSNRSLILSSLGLYVIISLGCVGGFFEFKRYSAELAFARALVIDKRIDTQLVASDTDILITHLEKATADNPAHHTYPRLLSQALRYKLTDLLAHTDSSNTEGIQKIREITGAAVDYAKKAADLGPHNVQNVENLAAIYDSVAPIVDGADVFTIKTYSRASELDPTNPVHHLNVGKFYLSQYALHTQRAAVKKSDQEKNEENTRASKSLERVESELKKALELKSDYAAPPFYLAILRVHQKNNPDALSQLDKAFDANAKLINGGGADPALFKDISIAYQNLGEKEKAMNAIQLSLNIQPNAPGSLWQFALLLADTGKRDDALTVLNQLLKNAPENQTIQNKIKEIQNPVSVRTAPQPQDSPDKKSDESQSTASSTPPPVEKK